MLYLIGLGLGDEKDITVRGLELVKSAERVYLEAYTSILSCGKERLEAFYGREIILADREMVESDSDSILKDAGLVDVCFLVVGDPYGATTHSDLVVRAKELEIPVESVHNASIMNAIGVCGLQLYNYGQTISIVFWTDSWRPDSFYDKIMENKRMGLHTLCLLDIKVKEQTVENMIKGNNIFEPPRYMSVNTALEQLLECDEKRGGHLFTDQTICCGMARIGQRDQTIISGSAQELLGADFGKPLHSLVISGDMHFLEAESLKYFAVNESTFDKLDLKQ
eukprot:Nk52_evm5s226 gene=Nk52_evmTU5s226